MKIKFLVIVIGLLGLNLGFSQIGYGKDVTTLMENIQEYQQKLTKITVPPVKLPENYIATVKLSGGETTKDQVGPGLKKYWQKGKGYMLYLEDENGRPIQMEESHGLFYLYLMEGSQFGDERSILDYGEGFGTTSSPISRILGVYADLNLEELREKANIIITEGDFFRENKQYPTWKIEFTPKGGKPEDVLEEYVADPPYFSIKKVKKIVLWVDKESGVIRKKREETETIYNKEESQGEMSSREIVIDYKEHEGTLLPVVEMAGSSRWVYDYKKHGDYWLLDKVTTDLTDTETFKYKRYGESWLPTKVETSNMVIITSYGKHGGYYLVDERRVGFKAEDKEEMITKYKDYQVNVSKEFTGKIRPFKE